MRPPPHTIDILAVLPLLLLAAALSRRTKVVARQADIRANVTRRLRRFVAGDWRSLLTETEADQSEFFATASPCDLGTTTSEEGVRAAREAMRLMRMNDLSRAMAVLTFAGIAAPSVHVVQQLREAIQGDHPPNEHFAGIGTVCQDVHPRITLDRQCLRKRLQGARKGSSPSVTGWR